MNKYELPSKETIDQIKAVFDLPWVRHPRKGEGFSLTAKEDGYHLTIMQMYDYVRFKKGISFLAGMNEIAALLGCKNGDEIDRVHFDGCETCDYGSEYTVEWRFW